LQLSGASSEPISITRDRCDRKVLAAETPRNGHADSWPHAHDGAD
jgi:hypothetical protein